jgi:hypothetical protein
MNAGIFLTTNLQRIELNQHYSTKQYLHNISMKKIYLFYYLESFSKVKSCKGWTNRTANVY